MTTPDDDLTRFEAHGAPPLPLPRHEGRLLHDGASIWHASFGDGPPVVLLHGGYGHAGNWGHQVPVLLAASFQVIVIDSRGHGRSTLGDGALSYERMAADTLAVLDHLASPPATLVGWSDGAVIALIAALQAPARVAGVLFFGCAMDPSGLRDDIEFTPVLQRCMRRHEFDYAALSPTPGAFETLRAALQPLHQDEPHYSAGQLARVSVPVRVVHSEHDEFIRREHALYLARVIPGATFRELPSVGHLVPLQRPDVFDAAMLDFVNRA
ncbi:alpha/beta fold hydrolase [Piscinibacter sp. HJYY11]|uniref:alpha/beta fold hydrolase n=1 Tax=Piscinibacter sp. HJYY11 TaxID=2801333 RepID=UPI00191EB984|nr:alpha/beta hydrolase [Piscinibacter sp. HJYY11]MBL0728227.1 alpha/beta hydrolase [Piscinibacter sp. HJYY11]